jgi:hypothetical protein
LLKPEPLLLAARSSTSAMLRMMPLSLSSPAPRLTTSILLSFAVSTSIAPVAV